MSNVPDSNPSLNDQLTDGNVSFAASGLPDDFDHFMAEVERQVEELTDAELCWLAEREEQLLWSMRKGA